MMDSKKVRIAFLLCAVVVWLAGSFAWGAEHQVVLEWDQNSEEDLGGYEVYYKPFGTAEYDWTSPICAVGKDTTECIANVPGDGEFVVKAVDLALNYSDASEPAVYDSVPAAPKNLRIVSAVVAGLQVLGLIILFSIYYRAVRRRR